MGNSKKLKKIIEEIDFKKSYDAKEAVVLIKKYLSKKFDESMDLAVILGIDAKKSDQLIRGVLSLPKGIGKKVKVAVFASGEDLDKAKKLGADIIGSDELVEEVKSGKIDFDKCIATPEMMSKVGTLGQILGPKGLMPNPKLGTVTKNIEEAIKSIKSGQIEYKTDKGGIVHATVGKSSFSDQDIVNNVKFLYKELNKAKPATSKGIFIKKIVISSTMGPGLKVDLNSVI
tara:strand:+ start:179 stop:868 length:690 start_codon:yes stop_codon:yes gene_type:complete